MNNLCELNDRYYLKNNQSTETVVPDDTGELMRESQVHFLNLNAIEVAVQLTLQDFAIFTQIESTEYVDRLFQLQSKYGTPNLTQFSDVTHPHHIFHLFHSKSELSIRTRRCPNSRR